MSEISVCQKYSSFRPWSKSFQWKFESQNAWNLVDCILMFYSKIDTINATTGTYQWLQYTVSLHSHHNCSCRPHGRHFHWLTHKYYHNHSAQNLFLSSWLPGKTISKRMLEQSNYILSFVQVVYFSYHFIQKQKCNKLFCNALLFHIQCKCSFFNAYCELQCT